MARDNDAQVIRIRLIDGSEFLAAEYSRGADTLVATGRPVSDHSPMQQRLLRDCVELGMPLPPPLITVSIPLGAVVWIQEGMSDAA